MITAERLKTILDYDIKTGVFTWKINSGKAKVGSVAGGLTSKGYVRIKVFDRKIFAHQLAWMYVNGEFPNGPIDHINRIKKDNRIENLRVVTVSQNNQNSEISKKNTSGLKGVSRCRNTGKWRAQIRAFGINKSIGYFDTAQAAHEAYCKAASVFHTHNPCAS